MKRNLGFALGLLVVTLGVWSISRAQNTDAAQENKPQAAAESAKPAQAAAKPDGDYVGSEVCVTCHAEQQKSFVHTIMGNAMAHPKTPWSAVAAKPVMARARPTSRPAAARIPFPSASPRIPPPRLKSETAPASPATTKGNQMFWQGSPHESRAMACVDCH